MTLIAVALLISWASGRTLVLAELLRPALELVSAGTSGVNHTVHKVTEVHDLEKRNAELEAQVSALEILVRQRDEQGLENVRLRQLLKMRLPPAAVPEQVARVIGRSPDNWHQRLLLDRGREQGLQLNAVVANDKGAIGRVVSLSSGTGLVSLMTDPQSAIAVLDTRTRSAGVVQGQGDAWPVLRYMEQPEKWKVGDLLITSGLGGIYPKGLPVGHIVQLKTASDSFFPELRVQPAVDLGRLEEVVVLPPGISEMPVPTPKPTTAPAKNASGTPHVSPSPGKL
ncbi:MAG TPA: rod shape-determining protein MreC [Oscillatoriaceae cyanobacterium]